MSAYLCDDGRMTGAAELMIEIPAGEVHLRDDRKGTAWTSRVESFRLARHLTTRALLHGDSSDDSSKPAVDLSWKDAIATCKHTFGRGRSDTRISRRRHRFSAVGPGRNWLPARHRGRVAVRMQGRHHPATATARSTRLPGTATIQRAERIPSEPRHPTTGACTT